MYDNQIEKVLDTPVTIRPDATKQRGDNTADELLAEDDYARVLIIRHLAAADRMEKGQMPACDYQYPDGSWCYNDATYFCMTTSAATSAEHTDALEHLALCSQHRVT